ncbi:MAG: hypothetical protein ABFD89_00755 [Bryobacteraceae bacterium]
MSITGWFLDVVSRRDDVKSLTVKVKVRAWVRWDTKTKMFVGYCPSFGVNCERPTQKETEKAVREAVKLKAEDVG